MKSIRVCAKIGWLYYIILYYIIYIILYCQIPSNLVFAGKSPICKQRHLYGSKEPKPNCNRDLNEVAPGTSACFMVSQHAVAGLGTKEECQLCLVPPGRHEKTATKTKGLLPVAPIQLDNLDHRCRNRTSELTGLLLAKSWGQMGIILINKEDQMATFPSSSWMLFAYQRFEHPKSENGWPRQRWKTSLTSHR